MIYDVIDTRIPGLSVLLQGVRRIFLQSAEKICICFLIRSIQKHCLDMHVHRKHTGEKFICGLCHYETFHRYSLNQHFKQQHQQEIEQSSEETCLVSVAPGVVISNNVRNISFLA